MEGSKYVPEIISVSALNGRSLCVGFSNGAMMLFDKHRLRGPGYIPLWDDKIFVKPVIKDGDLGWENLDLTIDAGFVYTHSVPYDGENHRKEYKPTKRDIIGERIATVLFPVMAIAGIIGILWWWFNQ